MKWLIVEDALRDRKGHWLEYVSTFVRELRALGDEVVVLCDRGAQGFVMEQTEARPVLPESIWHRMGDGGGAVKRYLRVPGHALATVLVMRKFFISFNHEKARKYTKQWDRGLHGLTRMGKEQGDAHGTCAGAAFLNSFTSELARDCENTSPTRFATRPAGALFADQGEIRSAGENQLAASKEFLKGQSQAGLQMDSQKLPTIRTANDPSASGEYSSVLIRDIRGSNSVTLDARRSTLDLGAAPDWIFVPTVLVHHLLGWWMLLKTGSVPGDSRVLLFFPNLPIRLDDTGKPHWTDGPTTRLMAWLFAQLRGEVESGKVVLGVETRPMRRALVGLICMRVVYLPHPVEFPAEARRRGDFFGNHTQAAGRPHGRLPQGCPKGEMSGSERVNIHEIARMEGPGPCLAGQAGAAFSNPSASELARDSENTSLIRSADAPASSAPATSYPPFAASASPIVFGCYGAARWEKGSDVFQEAIRLILKNEVASGGCRVASVGPDGIKIQDSTGQDGGGLIADGSKFVPSSATGDALVSGHSTLDSSASAAGRPLRFAIQWVEDFRDGEGNRVSIDPWLRDHPRVEVIGRYFEGDEYGRRLAHTDVMVLPYRKPYGLRVSRVVIEAMLNGMPVIATRGTTLFGQAEEFGVVVGCDDGDAESLAEAMLEVAEKFEMLRAEAEEKASDVAQSFSVSYFRDLLEKSGPI